MARTLRVLVAIATALVAVAVAAPAPAATTICVALLVDDADLGGGVHTTCAKVPQGATGYDVLRAGGHSFTICSNGVLGTIDGKPADGCHVKDNTHYWAYWHRAPGSSSWTYSNEGGGTYEPRNASTEGWVWQNGSTRQPANVPYSSICKPAASPKPTATPTRRKTATRTTASAPAATTKPRAVPTRSATRTATRATARPVSHPPTASPTASSSTDPPSPAPTVLGAEPASSHSSSVPVGLIVAVIAVIAVAAAAAWRQRRSG